MVYLAEKQTNNTNTLTTMSTKSTKPEEKGFFEKVKETIEDFWDGTKDKAEDLKETAENK